MGEKESMSGEALRESPSKASTGQTALRESPTRASLGRESSAPSVSERAVSGDPHEYQDGIDSPRDMATGQATGKTSAQDDWHQQESVSSPRDTASGQATGRSENIGSSGQDGYADDGNDRAAAARGNWDIKKNEGR